MARFILNGMIHYSTYVDVEGEDEPVHVSFTKSTISPRFVAGAFNTRDKKLFKALSEHAECGRKFFIDEKTKGDLDTVKKVVKKVAAPPAAEPEEDGEEDGEDDSKGEVSDIAKFKDARLLLHEEYGIENNLISSTVDLLAVAKTLNVKFPALEAKLED